MGRMEKNNYVQLFYQTGIEGGMMGKRQKKISRKTKISKKKEGRGGGGGRMPRFGQNCIS